MSQLITVDVVIKQGETTIVERSDYFDKDTDDIDVYTFYSRIGKSGLLFYKIKNNIDVAVTKRRLDPNKHYIFRQQKDVGNLLIY